MVLIAVGNGAFREAFLRHRFGELAARQIFTLLLILLLAACMAAVFRLWPLASARDALLVGLGWLALTLGFEFALGRFVSRLSWQEMLAEYDVFAGRVWILVPVWGATAPYVFYRWQQ